MTLHLDLIGGHGSNCPFLFPLPPLQELKAIMLHGVYDCGDGVILFMLPRQKDSIFAYRLLYTDSGHYLLPTDDPEGQKKEEIEVMEVVLDAFSHVKGLIHSFFTKQNYNVAE